MSVSVTRTKILLPRRRSDLISRNRLLTLLDDVLDYRFTLISAPAGYGKTSLLVDFAHQAEYPICWLSLDPLDQDIHRFLTHLLKSIQLIFPDFGSQTLSLIDNSASGSFDQEQLNRTLVNDIYENIPEYFVVILDDYHLVENNQVINNFFSRLGQDMDENSHFILSSRTRFDLPELALMVSRSYVKGLGVEDLAFQPLEIKQLLKDNYQIKISDQDSQTLASETEGWITGLLLSAESSPQGLIGQSQAAKVSGVDLFNYLTEQVFTQQSSLLQDFLLRTSYLETFNADFCKRVLGKSPRGTNWSKMISLVQQNNLFVQPIEDGSTWLRYHHLFRDYLKYQSRVQNPDNTTQILYRLLEVYKEDTAWEKAFAVVQEIDDTKAMAELIYQASSSLFHTGRINLLSAWIKILPEQGMEYYPELFALRGVTTTLSGDPLLGLSQLHQAVKHPLVYIDADILAQAYTWRAATYRILGRYPNALDDVLQAIDLSKSRNKKNKYFAEIQRETGLIYNNLGDTKLALSYLQRSLNSYRSNNDVKRAALVHMDLGILFRNQGKYSEAEYHYQQSLKQWLELNNINQQTILMNNLGVLSHTLGNYKKAKEWFDSALHKAKQTSNLRTQGYTYASLGDLTLDLGENSIALTNFTKSKEIVEFVKEGFLEFYLEIRFSTLQRKSGNFPESKRHLLSAYDLARQHSSRYELGLWHLEQARLLLDEGNYSSSEEEFLKASTIFLEIKKPADLAQTYLGLASVFIKSDKTESALIQLISTVNTLQPLGTFQPILSELLVHPDLLKLINDQSSSNPVLRSLEKNIDNFTSQIPILRELLNPPDQAAQEYSWLLDIQALGQLSVLYQGKTLSASEWVHQKTVRELFYYLLSKPTGVSKDQLGLIFWPDSSQDQFNRQFKNTIYLLRRAIGRETILYNPQTRRYSINQYLKIRYDVNVFMDIFHQAELEEDIDDRIQLYRDLVNQYRHPFAPAIDGIWTTPIRTDLILKYEKAALEAASFDLKQGNLQSCLDICRKLLEIEPGQESAWQLCMRAYAERGDRSNIIRVYQQCSKNLYHDLGLTPSRETEDLYNNLIQ
jgi:ATP/maltotriose-dependent transcriptional regulator MalT/DNA-binding SARP family transcriptional activator